MATSIVKDGFRLIGVIIAAGILGSILAAVADMTIASFIQGTVLGQGSSASPVAWTLIGIIAIVGFSEVTD